MTTSGEATAITITLATTLATYRINWKSKVNSSCRRISIIVMKMLDMCSHRITNLRHGVGQLQGEDQLDLKMFEW